MRFYCSTYFYVGRVIFDSLSSHIFILLQFFSSFSGPATCTEVVDTVDGQILDFACSASIIGPLNPQLTVLRDDQIVGRTIPLLLVLVCVAII